MNNPERVELTHSGRKGYHGNMTDANSPEFNYGEGKNGNTGGPDRQRQAEARARLERTNTGKSLRIYEMLKPKTGWQADDYARTIYMLEGDESEEAEVYKAGLKREATERGLEKERLIAAAEIEGKWGPSAKRKGSGIAGPPQEDDITARQIQMNYEQWKKMEESGELSRRLGGLNEQQFNEQLDYWRGMATQQAGEQKSREVGFALNSLTQEAAKRTKYEAGGGGGSGSQNGEGSGTGGNGNGGNNDGKGDGGGGNVWNRIEQNTARTAENTAEMVNQLNEIKDKLDLINKSILQTGAKYFEAMNLAGRDGDEAGGEKRLEEVRAELRAQDEEMRRLEAERRRKQNDINRLDRKGNREARGGERDVLQSEPWSEDDRELYEGDVDQVLGERMRRIEYFIAKGKNPGYVAAQANPNNPENDPNQPGISENERRLRESRLKYWQRMEEYYQKSVKKGDVPIKEGMYLQELQRWVKVIIRNSQFGTDNKLKISNESYEKFKKIADLKEVNLYQYGTGNLNDKGARERFEDKLGEVVASLREEKFLDYFQGNMREDSAFVSYSSMHETTGGGTDLPNSIEDTFRIIANTFSDKETNYRTGGNYQLINAEGEVQLKNFWKWITKESWIWSDRNSQGAIDLQNMILIKTTWQQLPIIQLLETPQYLQHREFTIRGNAENIKNGEKQIDIGWGEANPHPVLNEDVKEQIKRFLWMVSYRQSDWAKYYDPAVRADMGKWTEAQYDEARNGNYVRNGYGIMKYQAPAHRGNEVIDFFKNKKQGSLGQAEQDAVMFTRYLSEFTEYYMERDNKGKAIKVKELEDNMAYSVLDYDGSSSMLLHLSEVALEKSLIPTEIKTLQRRYVSSVMEAFKESSIRRLESDGRMTGEQKKEGRERLEFLTKKYQKEVMEEIIDEKMRKKVLFDKNAQLTELMLRVETEVMGRTLVTDDEYKKWEGFEDKDERVVTAAVVKGRARRLMRKNLYEKFFKPLMDKEVKEGKGPIGNMKVFVDKNRRVVTEAEWKELGEPGKITIREILDEFRDFGDENKDELQYGIEYAAAEKAGNTSEMRRLENKYREMFKRNERLAFGLLANLTTLKRSDLNYFNRETSFKIYNNHTLDIMGNALGDVYGLGSEGTGNEVEYVVMGAWYTAPQYRFDGLNNTSGGRKVTQSTAYNNTVRAMNADMGLEEKSPFFGEIKAITAPSALESWRIHIPGQEKPKTFLEVMQQGLTDNRKGRKVAHRWNRKLDGERREFESPTAELRYDFINGIYKGGSKIVEILFNEKEFHLQDAVTIDAYGNRRFDEDVAKKYLREYWDPLRLAFNKTHIDYDKIVNVDGREMTMRDYMFGTKTQETLDIIERYYQIAGDKSGKDAPAYKKLAEKIRKEPAVAVFANMVSTEIAEHMHVLGGRKEEWSLAICDKIWEFLYDRLRESGDERWEGNTPAFTKKPPMLPKKLLNRLQAVQGGGSREEYAFKKLGWAFIVGLFTGSWQIWQEAKDEFSQVNKTYTQSA